MPPFVAGKRRGPSPPPESTPPRKRAKKANPPHPAPPAARRQLRSSNARENKKFLESVVSSDDDEDGDEDEDGESLSDANSSDFEDVPLHSEHNVRTEAGVGEESNEEEEDWEDALHHNHDHNHHQNGTSGQEDRDPFAPAPTGDLELTLNANSYNGEPLPEQKKGPSKIERRIRIETHRMHVQFLMFHNAVRNGWACDRETQELLVRRLPPVVMEQVDKWRRASGDAVGVAAPPYLASHAKAKKKRRGGNSRKESARQRDWGPPAERLEAGAPDLSQGDPLISLLKILAKYWRSKFSITVPGLRKQGYKPIRTLEEEIASFRNTTHNPNEHGERVRSVEEFRKAAKKLEGSRDLGAQLLCTLIRGLGIEARLVANLQPVGFAWTKNEEASPKKKKAPVQEDVQTNPLVLISPSETKTRGSPPNQTPEKRSTRSTTNIIELSDSSSELSDLSSSDEERDSVIDLTSSTASTSKPAVDKDLPFPHYWVEAISPITHKVYPVDFRNLPSVAVKPEEAAAFEPRGAKADKAKQVIGYVIAHSADGTAKDVTTRYLKNQMWPGKTKGARLPAEKVPVTNRRGKIKGYAQYDWFKRVMSGYSRHTNLRTIVDDVEDASDLKPAKLERKTAKAGEETLQSYKQSPDYVLERFLRREEAILPGSKVVKMFKNGKGDNAKEEPVYLRKHVVPCKTIESWHKEGRQPKADCYHHALKHVPIRAVTLTRKREIEEATRQSNGVKPMQGLYSREQTEWIIPPPIEDGVIPKNEYGNIDCFVPSMVPRGAVHVPLRGTVRICKKLGIDFAEAVTGFEFGNKMAVPVCEGVVVAAENEHALIEAWEEYEAAKAAKEDEKRNKLVLGTWRKFLMGLRIVERVRDEYGDVAGGDARDEINPFTNQNRAIQEGAQGRKVRRRAKEEETEEEEEEEEGGGGFMPEDDRSDGEDHQSDELGGGFVIEGEQPKNKLGLVDLDSDD